MRFRVPVAATVAAFEPVPDRVQLVSFALWDDAEPEGAREPLAVDASGRTLVLRWPTDLRGRLDLGAVREGRVEVLAWKLTPGALAALAELRASWPLDLSDFWVSGDPARPRITPSLTTLRLLPLGLDLPARVSLALRDLAA